MTTEVYVSLNGLDYERLDLMKSETILMKYVYKDTQDLSKVYSPYSQSFALQGSLHNQRVLGFLGETKILKTKTNNNFDCKIYNNGLLAKKGLLKVTEVRYEKGRVKSFTANFTNSMLSLKDRMGEDKVSDLGKGKHFIDWSIVFRYFQGIHNLDGVNFIVPFMSDERVWQVNTNLADTTKLDNISYNPNADLKGDNFIKRQELNPAIQFRKIIDLIKEKYELDLIMPLEEEGFYNDLFVICNNPKNSSAVVEFSEYYMINPFYRTGGNRSKFDISYDFFKKEFKIKGNSGDLSSDYFHLSFRFKNVFNLKNQEDVTFTAVLIAEDGIKLTEGEVVVKNNTLLSDELVLYLKEEWVFNSNNFEFKFKIKMKTNHPVSYSDSGLFFYYRLYGRVKNGVWSKTVYFDNAFLSINNNSRFMAFNKIDLFASLPDLKVSDFLTSFFKTFNISIFETAPDDGRLYWLTPKDIRTQNKEYSSTDVDYTDYVIKDDCTKTISTDYNYYNFKHKSNKYYSNEVYKNKNGSEYGQLTYPEIKPSKDLREFKIETNFSIIPKSEIDGTATLYGFTNEEPNVLSNGALRYKPNTDDFTLVFFNGKKTLKNKVGYYNINGLKIDDITKVSVVGSTHEKSGFNLGFGLIENATNESLYKNYYKEQTERLLDPNTLASNFTLKLPPTELVLNYANTNQGESKVPSGFRLQNDIIIGETKYSIIDATIDQTTGKTTLNLLNYV